MTFPSSVTEFTDTHLSASDGSQIVAPAVGAYQGEWTIDANGAGSRIDLHLLTTIEGSSDPTNSIVASNKGVVSFGNQSPSLAGPVSFVLAGGTLEAGAIDLNEQSRLSGAGTVDADLINAGEIAPEGLLHNLGNFTQTALGRIQLLLSAGVELTRLDQLRVVGAALNGSLHVDLDIPFDAGEPYELLQFASSTGEFADILLSNPDAPVFVDKTPTSYRLQVHGGHQVRWDGGAGTLNWFDQDNWTSNQLPGELDDVVIPDLPGDQVIFYANSAQTESTGQIKSLQNAEGLSLATGDLTVTGPSQVNGSLTISEGRLIAHGPEATFAALGTAQIGTGQILADDGGQIQLANLSQLAAGLGGQITARDPGSTIDLSGVTTISAALDGDQPLELAPSTVVTSISAT